MLTSLLTPVQHDLCDPFEVAHGRSTSRQSLVVRLFDQDHEQVGHDSDNLMGYGEAPEVLYARWRVPDMWRSVDQVNGWLWEQLGDLPNPAYVWRLLYAQADLRQLPPAMAALDQALWDWVGKQLNQPTWALLACLENQGFYHIKDATAAFRHVTSNQSKPVCPASSLTIGLDDPQVMCDKLAAYSGWPIYKVKLGSGDIKQDHQIMQKLREQTDAILRVDANTAWTLDQTRWIAPRLAELGIEFIEQPMPQKLDGAVEQLTHGLPLGDSNRPCVLPIIADESCQSLMDIQTCRASGFDGVNIKPAKCGGLTPAWRMLHAAKQLNLQTMVGCMIESTIGISAIAQLLPWCDYADIDGANLIQTNPAQGVQVNQGLVQYSPVYGTGVHGWQFD